MTKKSILLTIDVEDWFQVENFKPWIPFSSWSQCELRVERNVHRILDLLDSTHNRSSTEKPKATFFILGWIAERLPGIVREIKHRGHEIASHGYNHELSYQMSLKDLKAGFIKSKKLLEDIIGAPVYGYRAPSFSISDEMLKVLPACGYRYDSSYNSFGLNSRYGKIDLSNYPRSGIAARISEGFYELPISNLELSSSANRSNPQNRFKFPLGGGGYFRLIPFPFFKYGIQRILGKGQDYLFYMHPWEIDPEQPKVKDASKTYQFRHYINLNKTQARLIRLIESFQQCQLITCKQYLGNKF